MRISPEIQVFSVRSDTSRKKVMLVAQQKSGGWIMDLASKFCKLEELVLNTYDGSLATA